MMENTSMLEAALHQRSVQMLQRQLEVKFAEAEYQFELELIQLGLLKTQPLKTPRTHFTPIHVAGQPLSEQIIAERR